MTIQIFLIIATLLQVECQLSLYINSAANTPTQNGTFEYPYTSFSTDLVQNLTENLDQMAVTLYFFPNGSPYELDFTTIVFSEISLSNPLTFTTYFSEDGNYNCGSFATIMIGQNNGIIDTDYLNIIFTNLVIENIVSTQGSAAFTINAGKLMFSITDCCIQFNTIPANVFFTTATHSGNITISNVNLTNSLALTVVAPYLASTVSENFLCTVDNVILEVLSKSGDFAFLDIQGDFSAREPPNNFASITNVLIYRGIGEYVEVMNQVFLITGFTDVFIQNITVEYISYNSVFFAMSYIQNLNVSNIYVTNQICEFCIMLYVEEGPSTGVIDNITFYMTSQLMLLYLDMSEVSALTVQNFNFLGSVLQSGSSGIISIFYYNLVNNGGLLVPLVHNNITIQDALLGGIIYAYPQVGAILQMIADYQIVFVDINIIGTTFNDSNTLFMIDFYQLVIVNSSLSNTQISYTFFADCSQQAMTGNIFLSNVSFVNVQLNPGCLIYTSLDYGNYLGTYLFYQSVVVSACTFVNFSSFGDYPIITNMNPFTILTNNIFQSISGDRIQLLSLEQETNPNLLQRNVTIENLVFSFVPSVLEVFDLICGTGSVYCSGGCYFNYISGNIFEGIDFFDEGDNSYLFFFNAVNYNIINLIINNIYINMISNGVVYSFPTFSNSTYIINEIRSNVIVGEDVMIIMGLQSLSIINNTYYQLNTPAMIVYKNLSLISTFNLTEFIPIVISGNIYYYCYAGPAFFIDAEYANQVTISNNIFGKFLIYTNDYDVINFMTLSVMNSVVDLIIDSNIFWNITMTNNFTQHGFYPSLTNSLIQAQLLTGVNLTISNNIFQNINLTMMLTNFMNIQAEKLIMSNLTFDSISLKNTQGFAFVLTTPYLRLTNITLTKFSTDTYTNYVGDIGIMLLTYVDVYYATKTNNIFVSNFSIKNWNEGVLLSAQGTYYNMIVSDSVFDNVTQVFVVSASGGYLLFDNIYYTSIAGKFLTTSQKHSVASVVSVSNYTQITKNNTLLRGAFDLNWHDLQFFGTNISISNLDILSTGRFVGLVNISDILITGYVNNGMTLKIDDGETQVILKNVTSISNLGFALMAIDTRGNVTVDVSKVLLSKAFVSAPFHIKVSNLSHVNFSLSQVVVTESKGVEFVMISIKETGIANFSMKNAIFDNGGFTIISADASEIYIENLIQVSETDLEPISDKGSSNQTTVFSNIIIHNTTSKKYWLNTGNKTLFMDSLVLSASLNGLKITNGSTVMVNNSIFAGNSNLNQGGGCINAQDSNIYLANSTMVYNSAPFGGVIFSNMSEYFGGLELENCLMKNNDGFYYGPSQASQAWKISVNTMLPENLNYTFLAYSNTTLHEVSSGYLQSEYVLNNVSLTASEYTYIYIYLSDYYGQPIKFGKQLPVVFELVNGQASTVLYSTNNNLQNFYRFLASDLPLPTANSYSNVSLIAKVQNVQIELILGMNARDCLPGEVVDNVTGYCTMCLAPLYSINPNNSCQPCPIGASCLGGQFINVSDGWWREPGTGNIYVCLDDGVNRCQGGIDTDNQCYTGFSGALCMGCDFTDGYSPSSVNRCKICSGDTFYMWLKNIGVFLAGYLYELVFIILAYVSNSTFVTKVIQKSGDSDNYYQSDAYVQSVKFFLFTNYLHIILLIVTYVSYIDTNLVVVMDKAELLVAISSSSITQNSDFSCWLSSMGFAADELTYVQVVFVTVFPIFKIALTCLLLFLMSQCRRTDHRRTKVSIIIISFISLDQNYLLQVLSQLRSCIIGEVEGYSQMNPNISCSDPTYNSFVNSYVIPNMIFWGIGIPLIFFILLFIFRNRLRERKIRFMMGGLMNNFDDRAFYWGLVILLLKQGLLIIFTLVSNPRDATIMGIILLGVYTYAAGKVKPYHSQSLNKVDKYSAFAMYITLIMFNQAIGNEDPFIMGIYIVGIFVIYGGIIGYLGFIAMHGVYQDLKKVNWREWLSARRRKSEMRISLDDSIVRSSTISSLPIESIELAETNQKNLLPQNI